MGKISFAGVSSEDKANLLGPEFRNIEVLDFEASDGVFCTRIVIRGDVITLIGDPQEALRTILGGQSGEVAQ